MSTTKDEAQFNLSISARSDGTLQAAYIRVSSNKVARTEEVPNASIMVDVDSEDNLVGIEILEPVPISQVKKIARRLTEAQRRRFGIFLKEYAPGSVVLVE
jgi:uncharacterized protein YuzE